MLRKEVCDQMPNRIWIEPTSVCNLECVMCPQSMEKEFSKGFMDIDFYKRLIDEVKHFAHDINLFHRGESTAHPKLAEMISYAKEAGLNTRLHTNGTLLNSQDLHGEAELRPGDSIRIGDTEFTFEVS